MDIRNVLIPALATLVSGLLIAAPAVAQEAQDSSGQAKDAAVSKAPLGRPLMFSVEGLTKYNIDKVTRSLTSLTENVYVCSGCKHVEAKAGKCIPCDIELEVKKQPILFEAVPSFKTASIQLTPFAARTLSYADLEAALTKSSIEIDDAKFPLVGESRLVLRGGSSENVKVIEKALNACGFFHSAQASYDTMSTEIHVVVHAIAAPPMRDKVAAVIDALDTKATLADVIWGPQAPLGTPLTFSVEGLTKHNIDKVTRSLTSLTENVYVCSGCKHVKAKAGKCIPCDIELEVKKQPILFEAVPSFKTASIQLTPFAARTLSYSDLEAALTKSSIEIDDAKFPLAGESRLVLRGGSSENVNAIEKALNACGFFHSAKASYDNVSTEIHVVVHAIAAPPMRDKVAAVIDALDTKATLVDVIWGPQHVPTKT